MSYKLIFKHKYRLTELLITIIVIINIIFWWTYKLSVFPGVHGDEAWFANRAILFNQQGIIQIEGMNYYTGIIQILMDLVSFKFLGLGVFNMRIGGVIFNVLGFSIICYQLYIEKGLYWILSFALIFAQSAFYLSYPRVAWEVNSFTLFFLSLNFVFLTRVFNNGGHISIRGMLFFLTLGIVGSYNHILYSALLISILSGLILWQIQTKKKMYKKLIILSGFTLVNSVLILIGLKYFHEYLLYQLGFIPPLIFAALAAETYLVARFDRIIFFSPHKKYNYNNFIRIVLVSSLVAFILLHGKSSFETWTSYKVLAINYSYHCNVYLKLILTINAVLLLLCMITWLMEDIFKNPPLPYMYIMVVYLGVICFFTRETSFRYYLISQLLFILYLSERISRKSFCSKICLYSLAITVMLMNYIQFQIFNNSKPLKARIVIIGNGQIENSAHYLPKEKVIRYLSRNNIGSIHYLDKDWYFLNEPIKFYKAFQPWYDDIENRAAVGYDQSTNNSTYILYLEK